ncbi:MAG: C40 family peptidase [Gemmatimonadaceae bacterium]
MHTFLTRWLILATTIAALAFVVENSAPPRQIAVEFKPRGWLHRRALRAFELKQLALRDSIVQLARAQLGAPYVFGGASPSNGFDCSGLVRWVFGQVRLASPRLAAHQARIGNPVESSRLSPGDLLTFGERDSITHVGIYIGDGRFVHASSVAGKVIVSPLDRRPAPQIKPFVGARRVLTIFAAATGI